MNIQTKQLQNQNLRFVRLGQWNLYKNKQTKQIKIFYPKDKIELVSLKDNYWNPLGKVPMDPAWQTTNNYTFNHPLIQAHNFNIGIVCGPGRLKVLDCDNLDFAISMSKLFPKTFSVRTGGGGLQFYFFSNLNQNQVLKKDNEPLGELRANCQQCVIPGCRHPLNTYYKVEYNSPINEIAEEKIKEILGPYFCKTEKQTTIKTPHHNQNISGDSWTQGLAKNVKLSELSLKYFGCVCCPSCRNQNDSYFNYDDSRGFWKCWACGAGGNLIEFIIQAKNNKTINEVKQ